MARFKERPKFIHEPSTQEVFQCLKSMICWSSCLYEHGQPKDYMPFLKTLIDSNFLEGNIGKVTIKTIAAKCGVQTTKATKWLHEIYHDIFELNNEKEELFTNGKLPVTLFFSYFDSAASFTLGLNVIPRQYEDFDFYFIRAKLGGDRFWIRKVEYEVQESIVRPFIWLEGGILNRYREMAIDEALFKGWIGFMDQWHKSKSEIDEILRKNLR